MMFCVPRTIRSDSCAVDEMRQSCWAALVQLSGTNIMDDTVDGKYQYFFYPNFSVSCFVSSVCFSFRSVSFCFVPCS